MLSSLVDPVAKSTDAVFADSDETGEGVPSAPPPPPRQSFFTTYPVFADSDE